MCRLRSEGTVPIDYNEKELFTQCRWGELVEEALPYVPCLGVAVCHLKGTSMKKVYDAISLERYLQGNPHALDPATRREFERIEYQVIQISTLNERFQLVPNRPNILFTSGPVENVDKFALESNNYRAEDPKRRSDCQYIVGIRLLKEKKFKEAYTCLSCSAASDNHLARIELLRRHHFLSSV